MHMPHAVRNEQSVLTPGVFSCIEVDCSSCAAMSATATGLCQRRTHGALHPPLLTRSAICGDDVICTIDLVQ